MRLLTRDQARQLDTIAMQEMGIPGETLMGNAGKAVAEEARKIIANLDNPRIAILCGKGNNGGDGFTAALDLVAHAKQLVIYSIPQGDEITGDAKIFFNQCREKEIPIVHGTDLPKDQPWDLIIDALLGTGFRGELRDPIGTWTAWINRQNTQVLSVDIPSGVDSNTGLVAQQAIRADMTVTMGSIKVGMLLEPGKSRCGPIIAADIGFPDVKDRLQGMDWGSIEADICTEYLTPPPVDTYKHRQGKVLIIAGSAGMTGAAVLASRAALRCGAGLVKTCAPLALNPIYETHILEGMTIPCQDEGTGHFIPGNLEIIRPHLDGCDAVLIGPGIGAAPETLELVLKLVHATRKPMVIDADALRIFHQDQQLLSRQSEQMILTPHYGEWAQIIHEDTKFIRPNLPPLLEDFISRFPGILALKNAPTLVAQQGKVRVNTTGNPALASGGTGDVFAGMSVSFLAQGIPPFAAIQIAAYIHGLAADELSETTGFRGLLASDIIEWLPELLATYEHQ